MPRAITPAGIARFMQTWDTAETAERARRMETDISRFEFGTVPQTLAMTGPRPLALAGAGLAARGEEATAPHPMCEEALSRISSVDGVESFVIASADGVALRYKGLTASQAAMWATEITALVACARHGACSGYW